MWSVGCILGELLGGKPMFPGTSTMNQLDRIIEVTGRPSPTDIEAIQSEFAATMLDSLPDVEPRSLQSMYPNASEDAIDLLRKLLMFNPEHRITAEQALEHPYLSQFHNSDEEPSCDKEIKIPIDDNKKLSVAAYREELYTSIIKVAVVNKEKRAKKPKKKATAKKAAGEGTKKKKSTKAAAAESEKKKPTKKKAAKKDTPAGKEDD